MTTIKTHKQRRVKAGRYLGKGLRTLKWAYKAQTIKKAIPEADIRISFGYQIPATNSVAKDIFAAPTALRIKVDKPKCSNSWMILSKRNTHTMTIDAAIITWEAVISNSIFNLINIVNDLAKITTKAFLGNLLFEFKKLSAFDSMPSHL